MPIYSWAQPSHWMPLVAPNTRSVAGQRCPKTGADKVETALLGEWRRLLNWAYWTR